MKINSIIISTMCIVVFAFGCKENKKQPDYMRMIKGYQKWKKPVNKILDYPVPGHGKGARIIFANDITYNVNIKKDSLNNERVEVPEGSIVVKEVYPDKKSVGKKKPALTVMIKNKKSSDSVRGWIYFVMKPGMKKPLVVKSRMCIGCHEAANERHLYFDGNPKNQFRDYLFVPFKKK